MESEKIGFAEALCVLLIINLSHLVLTLPKTILKTQGSSSILNIIYVTLLGVLAIFILTALYKNFRGKDILDISEFLFGRTFKVIIGFIFITYFLFVASLLLRNTSENLKTMYLQNTPIPYIVFFLVLAVGFISKFSLKNIIKCNLVIVPLIIVSLSGIFIFSSGSFTFERVFPILGYGAKNTFINGMSNIFIFGNMVLLFFIMPMLKDFNNYSKVSFISILLSGLFVLLTIISILLIFPLDIASSSNVSIYLQTKEITFGKLIQRSDAFFVLIWILTMLSYLSISVGFTLRIFKKITNIQNSSAVSYLFIAILYGISLLYTNIVQIRNFTSDAYKYIFIIAVFGFCFSSLIIANIKKYFQNTTQRRRNKNAFN